MESVESEEKYSFAKVSGMYEDAKRARSSYESEWKKITKFLLPGRGKYSTSQNNVKRELTNSSVINSMAEDALYVLVSGMSGALTSPSRPWFVLDWRSVDANSVDLLKQWLQNSTERLHSALHQTSFYSDIVSIYTEAGGFGTAAMYVGEDSGSKDIPFRFETLTVGEYAFTCGTDGIADKFFRTIYMSKTQLVKAFGDNVSEKTRDDVSNNVSGIDVVDVEVVEFIVSDATKKKKFTRYVYDVSSNTGQVSSSNKKPLEIKGFHEFPYVVARWSTIGNDVYGVGPGSRALKDIMRLQEMEKSFMMAIHKDADPPLNVPSRMRGRINRMPGGINYYSNPGETVNELYKSQFNMQGVATAIDRVESSIKSKFFNDIFLTAMRDPNASPLKATQVDKQEREGMLRMGPVVERFQHEFLSVVIERCFNIMLRKGLFEPLDPELAKIAGDFSVSLVSPLATAQRSVALNGINQFLGLVGQVAQFDPNIKDKINTDGIVDEYADITGVKIGAVIRLQKEVDSIREANAKAAVEEIARNTANEQQEVNSNAVQAQANATLSRAEAGVAQLKGQKIMSDIGV